MTSASSATLELRPRLSLGTQRWIAWLLAPISFTCLWLGLRVIRGYRIEDLARVRREHREIRARSDAPMLVCANHLTLVDSFLIAWALGSPFWFFLNFQALPWNVPDQRNFAATPWQRALVYALKCLPIRRGGRRTEATEVLARVAHLLRVGDSVLIFPEGGRSRTGSVEVASAATGVGRVIRSVDGCRVLCVYLRGDRQRAYSDLPARGDRFNVALSPIEPKTDDRGLRGSRDLVRQVVSHLREMEQEYFDGRQ